MGDPFIDALRNSRKAVLVIADLLMRNGCDIVMRAYQVRPDMSQIDDYSDSGDLFILRNKKLHRVEVRHQQRDWTDKESFRNMSPHGACVGPVRNDSEKITRWFHVNKQMTNFYSVRPDSRPSWKIIPVRDGTTGMMKDNYFAPIEAVKFGRLARR